MHLCFFSPFRPIKSYWHLEIDKRRGFSRKSKLTSRVSDVPFAEIVSGLGGTSEGAVGQQLEADARPPRENR